MLIVKDLTSDAPAVVYSLPNVSDTSEVVFTPDSQTVLVSGWANGLKLMALDPATGQSRLVSGDLRVHESSLIIPLADNTGALFLTKAKNLDDELSFVSLTEDKQLLVTGIAE